MDPNLPPPLAQPKDIEHLRLLALFHYIVGGAVRWLPVCQFFMWWSAS